MISVEYEQKPVESIVNTTKKSIQNDEKRNQELYPNNFLIPIKDACITERSELLPGAPRTYRNGIHEGVDFYDGFSCTKIDFGTANIIKFFANNSEKMTSEYLNLFSKLLHNRNQIIKKRNFLKSSIFLVLNFVFLILKVRNRLKLNYILNNNRL